MPEIKLGGQQHEFLRIVVSSREYTDAEDYWDGNWLNCEVEVMAGRFRGRVLGTFRAEEFARLRSDVASLVESDEGQASFATMECQLSFELIKDKMGGVRCKGVLMEDPAQEDRLISRFSSISRTFLAYSVNWTKSWPRFLYAVLRTVRPSVAPLGCASFALADGRACLLRRHGLFY